MLEIHSMARLIRRYLNIVIVSENRQKEKPKHGNLPIDTAKKLKNDAQRSTLRCLFFPVQLSERTDYRAR